MKTEIRVGGKDIWRDRLTGRRMKVAGHDRSPGIRPRVWLRPVDAGYRASSMFEDSFLIRFELEPKTDAPPRRISLTLAADTTATECGACPLLQTHDERVGSVTSCGRWGGDMGHPRMRLPECIAAEVPNG